MLSKRHFRSRFALAVYCCSVPRRRVTKQFICHHVRLRWTSDLFNSTLGTFGIEAPPMHLNAHRQTGVNRLTVSM